MCSAKHNSLAEAVSETFFDTLFDTNACDGDVSGEEDDSHMPRVVFEYESERQTSAHVTGGCVHGNTARLNPLPGPEKGAPHSQNPALLGSIMSLQSFVLEGCQLQH